MESKLGKYRGVFQYALVWLIMVATASMPHFLYHPEDGSRQPEKNKAPSIVSPADAELLPNPIGVTRGHAVDFSDSAVRTYNIPHLYRKWDVTEPALDAPLALAIDLDSGFVFFLKGDQHTRWPIASISKLLTASVARRALDPAFLITIQQSDVDTEGTAGNLRAGEIYSADALIKTMLLTSSNDAAVALARTIGETFVTQMRGTAENIGMNETRLDEPTGLSQMNQSTMANLAQLLKYLIRSEKEILSITTQQKLSMQERSTGHSRIIQNINRFAGSSNFLGGKTGFIDSSGGNLVSVFQYQHFTIATIVLGATDRFVETERILNFIKTGYKF